MQRICVFCGSSSGKKTEYLDAAKALGKQATFHQPDVAVFQGEPGIEVPDPYFGGKGPTRTGCTYCGGCMVGCRHDSKNTLDKNYLYLAEQWCPGTP